MIVLGRYSMEKLIEMFRCEGCGSIVSYFGFVRSQVGGKKVKVMMCETGDNTRNLLEKIEIDIRKLYPVKDVLLYHSTGRLKVGDLVAAVLVCTVHRKEGFDACRYGIDEIKKREPVKRIDVYEE